MQYDLAEELGYSQQYYKKRSAHLVCVRTDNGIEGWGECFGPGNIALANKFIIENQQKELYSVIDLYPLFVNKKEQLKNNLTYDGLHLNEQGYEVWSNLIKPITDSF